ncbi:hypothetical protein ACT3CE_15990 [Marinifilum sp. RC60d5]|uniref:hypothetical protein n=1 Tax=Marinifilum sp. RC60d5 TaxID=3458414 RepID=UPI004035D91D
MHTNKVEYTIEDLFLYRKFYGDIRIEDLRKSLDHIIKNEMIHKSHKGLISDFSDVNFLFSPKDLLSIKSLFTKNHQILSKLRLAQIVTSPQIVLPVLFADANPDVVSKSFSTFEAARNWVIAE